MRHSEIRGAEVVVLWQENAWKGIGFVKAVSAGMYITLDRIADLAQVRRRGRRHGNQADALGRLSCATGSRVPGLDLPVLAMDIRAGPRHCFPGTPCGLPCSWTAC